MKLSKLKQQIKEKILSDQFLILLCEDDNFIADQYIEAISQYKMLEINNIESLADINKESALSLVFDLNSNLNVLKTELFSEFRNFEELTNTIVVCNKIDSKIKSSVDEYVVKIPKLQDWQISDFLLKQYKGFDEEDTSWLYKVTSGNIYRIQNELDKLSVFEEKDRKLILAEERFSKESDLVNIEFFEFSNAILDKKLEDLLYYYKHRDYCDFEPMSLIANLLNTLKKLVLVKYNSGTTYEDLGISSKQFYWLQRSVCTRNLETLKKNIDFLSSLDLKLKSGKLDFKDKNEFIDYIICNLI